MTKSGNPKNARGLLAWAALLAVSVAGAMAAPVDPYAPLWFYNGSWQVTRKDAAAGAAADKLVNACARTGHFFVCEQTVNGGPGALLIFMPTDKPGHYYTQNIRPEGRSAGRGDLEIQANTWVYTTTWDDGGHKIYYRTTNVFKGRTSIHFEQAESTDNKTWVVKNSGEEVRVGGAKP